MHAIHQNHKNVITTPTCFGPVILTNCVHLLFYIMVNEPYCTEWKM